MSTKTLPRLPIFEAISMHDPSSTAVIHSISGRSFTYGQLLQDVASERNRLLREAGSTQIEGTPVAFLVENGYDYVVTLLSIFGAHSIALPVSPALPTGELQYILQHSGAPLLLSSKKFESKAREVLGEGLGTRPRLVGVEKRVERKTREDLEVTLQGQGEGNGGLILYTSGTTNRPKGVFLPQSALTAQCRSLYQAWKYSPADHLLHVLPLHHIHGLVNALLTPLFAGSTIEFLFPFNATQVWERLAAPFISGSTSSDPHQPYHDPGVPSLSEKKPITFLTVVPTIYTRLLNTFPSLAPSVSSSASLSIERDNLRLPQSGSSSLPPALKASWSSLSQGNHILERYGMTEIGMALSCGLGMNQRVDGSVGWPLPGVEVRLVDLKTGNIIKEGDEVDEKGKERDGEILVRGPAVFKEYWRNPEATTAEFVTDPEYPDDESSKWFRTGDVAVRRHVSEASTKDGNVENYWAKGKMYFIRGRKSQDIIKSGGEKVSALEVEREIAQLDVIREVAVVGIPSGRWGEKVGAVVILNSDDHDSTLASTARDQRDHGESGRGEVGGKEGEDDNRVGAIVVLKEDVEGKRGGEGSWGAMDLRRALRERLANYKIPRVVRVVDDIPRNAMGKINKKELVRTVFEDDISGDEM